jgi:hypothetical protein
MTWELPETLPSTEIRRSNRNWRSDLSESSNGLISEQSFWQQDKANKNLPSLSYHIRKVLKEMKITVSPEYGEPHYSDNYY